MLGKLMKYEIKATARTFLPFYGALLVLSLINRITLTGMLGNTALADTMAYNIFSAIAATLYGITIATIYALTLIVMVQRFYKNLFDDEGYLMMTLPVKPWKHIVAKGIIAVLWLAVSTVLVVISALIMAATLRDLQGFFTELGRLIAEISTQMQNPQYAEALLMALEVLVFGLVCLAFGVMIVYVSIAVGQLLNRHKLLGAFGVFIGIGVVFDILMVVVMNSFFTSISVGTLGFHQVMLTMIAFFAAFTAVCFVGTDLILQKKLNLE